MKYFLGFLAAVTLIIIVFILVLRGLGGDRRPALETELIDYAPTQTVMRMTVEGRVNVDQEHRAVRVTIGRDTNTVNLIEGYEDRVTQTKTYDSNESAYATFLRALHLKGYTKGDDNPDLEDSRGFCPTGKTYTFEIVTGSSSVQKFWTTSCGGGTFKGETAVIRQLFRAQIPDYFRIIRGTGLN